MLFYRSYRWKNQENIVIPYKKFSMNRGNRASTVVSCPTQAAVPFRLILINAEEQQIHHLGGPNPLTKAKQSCHSPGMTIHSDREPRQEKVKIQDLPALRHILERERAQGKTIVFTNGCFDLIHVGHIRTLFLARQQGDLLVVGINSDDSVRAIKGEGRPLVPQQQRAEVLAALEAVDYVVIFNEPDPHRLIEELRPHILVKGGDWPPDQIIGRDLVEARGGRVVCIDPVPGASTTAIIETILDHFSKQ
jgi:rfaE bifunctional protein nucleotidyltransferase chain/domain